MPSETLREVLVDKSPTGEITAAVRPQTPPTLAAGQVLVRVAWSSLNYKDALAVSGHPGVIQRFPQVPGIDAAGVVEASTSPSFTPSQEVIVTSHDLGVSGPGGWSNLITVPAEWIVPLPEGLTMRDAMLHGTAGLTAGLCVDALIKHGVTPERGDVLVTGATGGVGSIAVRLLAQLGYRVVATTGKAALRDQLQSWGAQEVLERDALADQADRPLLKPRFAGVVDCVGGATLVSAIKQTLYGGCITACGLAGGAELPLSVYPFILRGVTLVGIDSVWCDFETRSRVWRQLASDWQLKQLDDQVTEATLYNILDFVPRILRGEVAGRVIVKL